jgi:outer membrane protein OmpA-like peptidoglycan-associated protein
LSFNLSTGALTGTPTETSTATVYTITGTNPRGTDTATFTLGVNLRTISIAAVPITAPVSGATPLASISSNGQYTTAITWNGSPSTFAASTIYTAIATVTPVTNYTLTGVTANFFTVTGATSVSNSANAGVITAVFPATSAPTPPPVTPPVAEVYKYPEQTSSITSITQGCPTDVNTVVIKGSFLAPIANIFINNQAINSSLWKQTATQVVITINPAGAKSLAIQIFNGQVPILATQNVEIATSCPVTPPTPTPTTKPTPTPTPTPPNNPQPTAQMVKVGTVYMATGLYQLSPVAKKQLAAFAKTINSSAAKTILVYGHTDIRGGVNNTLLSQNRAKAVAAYLRPLLKVKKISIGWYASRKPASTGTTPADLALNRRVEIYTK